MCADAAVSRETLDRLGTYVDLLRTWTQRIRLVGTDDPRRIWEQYVWPAASLARWIPGGATHGVDLGSGAGLPGLILSIVTGLPFTLVEADRRKAAFLREAGHLCGAAVTVQARRIEQTVFTPAPIVTAQALASLPTLLRYCLLTLTPDGVAIFPKGEAWLDEVHAARRDYLFRIDVEPHPGAAVVLLVRQVTALTALGAEAR